MRDFAKAKLRCVMRKRSAEHENLINYVRRCLLTSSAKRVTLAGVDKEGLQR